MKFGQQKVSNGERKSKKKAIWDVKINKKTYQEAAKINNVTYNKLYRHVNGLSSSFKVGRKSCLTHDEINLISYFVLKVLKWLLYTLFKFKFCAKSFFFDATYVLHQYLN